MVPSRVAEVALGLEISVAGLASSAFGRRVGALFLCLLAEVDKLLALLFGEVAELVNLRLLLRELVPARKQERLSLGAVFLLGLLLLVHEPNVAPASVAELELVLERLVIVRAEFAAVLGDLPFEVADPFRLVGDPFVRA